MNLARGSSTPATRRGGPSDPDLALLDRWREGDLTAGQELVGRYFAPLYRFFENKCEREADELVQSTLLACVRARDQFRRDASFRTYLFAIARNELHRYFRQKRGRDQVDLSSAAVAQLVTTPGTRLDRSRMQRQLSAALRELSVDQQILLELYYWQELEVAELAEVLAAPPATIRTWLFRARAALRARLASGRR